MLYFFLIFFNGNLALVEVPNFDIELVNGCIGLINHLFVSSYSNSILLNLVVSSR